MKIGILTFWKTEDNYGQLLQCYATQTFLQSLGHETFLIRATNGKEYNPTLKEQILSKLRTAFRLLPYPIYLLKRGLKSAIYTLCNGKLKQNVTDRDFKKFRQDYLNATKKEYNLEMLKTNPPQADAYIVGSDQIWNTTDGIYFLSWANDKVKKISIAASFGSRQSSEAFCNLIRPWLQRFDLITCRESSGLSICAEAGRKDAHLIPDPTLLLQKDDYLKIATVETPKEPYIFIYFLGTRTKINWKEIHRFAKSEGLRIVYVGSQGVEDKFKKIEPDINQWLSLMANAEFVITNSFHGTIFAMQFQKKFLVYPVMGSAAKMNDRLTTLLNPLALQDRIFQGNIFSIEKPIDYNKVFQYLDLRASRAKDLFSSALEE